IRILAVVFSAWRIFARVFTDSCVYFPLLDLARSLNRTAIARDVSVCHFRWARFQPAMTAVARWKLAHSEVAHYTTAKSVDMPGHFEAARASTLYSTRSEMTQIALATDRKKTAR